MAQRPSPLAARTLRALAVAGFSAAMLPAGALAQIVTPAPGAPAPLPEFTPPPPPPPPAPTPPPAPPVDTPSVVSRDAQGSMVLPPEPPEFLAVRALNVAPDRKAMHEAFLTARTVEAERAIAANPLKALELRKKLDGLDKLTINDLANFQPLFKASSPAQRPLDAIAASSSFLPPEVEAVRKSFQDFSTAMGEEIKKLSAGDISKTMSLAAQRQIAVQSIEPMNALNRVLDDAVNNWDKAARLLQASPDAQKLTEAMKGPASATEKRGILAQVIANMPADEAGKFLGSFGTTVGAK
jgi:hypothetical protein